MLTVNCFQVKEAVNTIKMNSAEIAVQSAKFVSGSATFESTAIQTNDEDETIILSFAENLPLGKGQVLLNFTGILNDKLRGFYRSCYTG